VPAFVDTNILVYAVDETEGGKREIADEVVEKHLVDRDGFISVQVLREFHLASRRMAKPLPGEVRGANGRSVLQIPGRAGVY
jgi:predicted nucleic acid-binding protein